MDGTKAEKLVEDYSAVSRSLEALKHLKTHEGWKLYMAMLDGQKADIMAKIENSQSGEQMLRLGGAVAMHRIAANWVDVTINSLETQLKTIVQAQQKNQGR